MVSLFTRLSSHDIELSFFVSERESRKDIGADTDAKHKDVGERKRDLDDDESNERNNFRNIGSQQIDDSFLEVIKDLSAFFNTNDN